jgi:hypothetical protein
MRANVFRKEDNLSERTKRKMKIESIVKGIKKSISDDENLHDNSYGVYVDYVYANGVATVSLKDYVIPHLQISKITELLKATFHYYGDPYCIGLAIRQSKTISRDAFDYMNRKEHCM